MDHPSIPSLSETEAQILSLLIGRSNDMYGLQLVRESGGSLKRGTIYVTLGRMEEKGFVSSREEREDGTDLPRRFYRVTGLGRRVLSAREAAAAVLAPGGLLP
jgi:PadR family transcriptional regulator, regulatory protein PadR